MAVPVKLLQLAGWLRSRQAIAGKEVRRLETLLERERLDESDALILQRTRARQTELALVLIEVDRMIDMPDVFRQNEPSDVVEAVKLDVVIKTAWLVLDEPNADVLAGATRVVDAVCASLARFLSVVILEPPPGLVEVIHRLEERDAVVVELLVDMIASDLARASRAQQGGKPE